MNSIVNITCAAALLIAGQNALAGGDPAKGKAKADQLCQSCHGADGNSPTPQFPKLAGQYADYIVTALAAYKSGERKNPIMLGIASGLSAEDRENLGAYFASQNGLHVLRKVR